MASVRDGVSCEGELSGRRGRWEVWPRLREQHMQRPWAEKQGSALEGLRECQRGRKCPAALTPTCLGREGPSEGPRYRIPKKYLLSVTF